LSGALLSTEVDPENAAVPHFALTIDVVGVASNQKAQQISSNDQIWSLD